MRTHQCRAGLNGMDVQAPADGEVEDEVVEFQGEAETIPLRTATSPQTPSAKAREEHRSSGHIPFRDWCSFCINGRGLENQHRPTTEESSIPVVGLDYFFITASDFEFKRKAELEYDKNAAGDEAFQADIRSGKIVKCVIVRWTSTKVIFGHCIPYKGAGEDQYVANLVVQAVEWLGHTRLILKSDNEPALHTLVEQSLEEIRIKVRGVAQISTEHPPRYDSQSNASV